MLLVFVATQGGSEDTPPELIDLMVQDSETRENIPVGGLPGWDNDFLQVQTLTYSPCTFLDAEEFTSAGDTGTIWCRRLKKGLVNASFSDSGASAVLRVLRYDANGILSVSEEFTITAGTRQDGSNYIAPVYEYELNGANKCAIEVVSVSAGTVYIRQAGI